mmetsp:Transcript_10915/g.67431  ORF Transcript_10915/g.67431 Transcript_10915/m.67431 type:complete len:201 (-) Transcript_10915:3460-4062(-)
MSPCTAASSAVFILAPGTAFRRFGTVSQAAFLLSRSDAHVHLRPSHRDTFSILRVVAPPLAGRTSWDVSSFFAASIPPFLPWDVARTTARSHTWQLRRPVGHLSIVARETRSTQRGGRLARMRRRWRTQEARTWDVASPRSGTTSRRGTWARWCASTRVPRSSTTCSTTTATKKASRFAWKIWPVAAKSSPNQAKTECTA